MKILMYGWEFPPHISGGLGTACFGLTQALASQGHKITFVLPRLAQGGNQESHVSLVASDEVALRDGTETYLEKGIALEPIAAALHPYVTSEAYRLSLEEIERISNENTTTRTAEFGFTADYGPNLMAEIRRYAAVAGKVAKRVPHEIIHAHDWLTIPAGIEAKRISRKPLVVHIHSLEFDRCGENINPEVYAIERLGMEKADKIISVSHFTKNRISKYYGINPDKVRVVHNAVLKTACTPKAFPVKKDKMKIVLFLGRITFQKGPDYFVEAAAKVLSVRKDVCFVMAGTGDMMHRMIERVAELRIGRHFHFPGFLRGNNVDRMYAMSNLYVMPSVAEPFGISPLEAIQHKVPTIISKQSGISEVIGAVLKVNFWDVRDLAGKIMALLQHQSLSSEISKMASRELDAISWEKSADRVSSVYGELLKAA